MLLNYKYVFQFVLYLILNCAIVKYLSKLAEQDNDGD